MRRLSFPLVAVVAALTLICTGAQTLAQETHGTAASGLAPAVFPTPRQASYGALDLRISDPNGACAAIVLPNSLSPTLLAAAEDLNAELSRIAPEAAPLPVLSGQGLPEGLATEVILGVAGRFPLLDAVLGELGLNVTATEPGPGGYRIAVIGDNPTRVLLVGSDEQGAYWAARSFAQLLRRCDDGSVCAYSAQVRDWPGFAKRMTTVDPVYESNWDGLRSMKARMSRVLGLKYNVSCYGGDSFELNDWLRPRGFRAGSGYWTLQHIGAKANELGIKPSNWFDERLNSEWVERFRQTVQPRPGIAIWHDCTDAGWFNKYLDVFWETREQTDREAFPQAHPALADAHRLRRIYDTVKKESPDTELYFTVPCYYDTPENPDLPRVALFRDYLKTLGRALPNDITWVLEDRGPLTIAAYGHYLGGRCMNYRYPFADEGSLWSTNFTSARHAAGYTDAYWFCVGHYQHDLMMACAAQYLWNPDTPDDYEHITSVVVPQAARYLYGAAWQEMAEFIVALNINERVLRSARQPAIVRDGVQRVNRGAELLRSALTKIEPTLADGRHGIKLLLAWAEWIQGWMGLKLTLAETDEQMRDAETFLAFGKQTEARVALDAARVKLGQLDEDALAAHDWLAQERSKLAERIAALTSLPAAEAAERADLGVLALDGEWLFRLDPGDTGLAERWFAADPVRADWTRTAVPLLWEQGAITEAASYDGIAWYMRSFALPSGWQGRRIIIHFGAVDDEATVWVNGQRVGEHLEKDHPTSAWEEPFEFDITEVAHWEGENTVVVRVNDTHGGGGIWRSVHIRAQEPTTPPPGPGDVEVKTEPRAAALAPPTGPDVRIETSKEVNPGWEVVLKAKISPNPVTIRLKFDGYGPDPAATAGRELTDKDVQWLTGNRVGRLGLASVKVAETEIGAGFSPGLRYSWDGYAWRYQTVDKAEIRRGADAEAILIRGRTACADYGRFELDMTYEYELVLRDGGTGYEKVTLIPAHDTAFSPVRNGPAYGTGSSAPAVSGLALGIGGLTGLPGTAFVAPIPGVTARRFDVAGPAQEPAWSGTVRDWGIVGAFSPAVRAYCALLAPLSEGRCEGAIAANGEGLLLSLLRPIVANWPAGSRNSFARAFALGHADDTDGATAAIEGARAAFAQSGRLPVTTQ